MTLTMLSTMSTLALLVGLSGCYYPFHGHPGWDRQTDRQGDAYRRAPQSAATDREAPRSDCWHEGTHLVCRY